MLIWFIEIPIVFIFIAGIMMLVLGKMLVDAVTGIFMAVGAVMLFIAVVSFFISVVMQHIDEAKLSVCDRISKLMVSQGAILCAVGFLIRAALNTAF